MLMEKEPPDHTRLKSLVAKVFTPRTVENLRGNIQQISERLLEALPSDAQFDLLEDFATPLPVIVIAELLGAPESDRHLLRPWSHDIVAMYELNYTPQQAQRANQAVTEFTKYLQSLVEARRRHPRADLISELAAVEESGDRLSSDELIATCILLFNAGHEATVNAIGNGMWALMNHPQQMQKLKDDLGLIKTAVDEMLRYDSPLQLFKRWVLVDMEYKGSHFKPGEQLAFLYGAANRDPNRFANPNQLDITRKDNPHLSFGSGIHYCLGAPLARLEIQIAVSALLRRMPHLQPVQARPERRPSYVIRGYKTLPVRNA